MSSVTFQRMKFILEISFNSNFKFYPETGSVRNGGKFPVAIWTDQAL